MTHIREFEPVLPDPQPFIEKALALYRRAVDEGRGRVVFIASELGGGKTELLGALGKALHRAEPAPEFIAGFFRGGEYRPHVLEWQRKVSLSKAALAAGGVGSQLGLIPNPYTFAASFIGQLLVTITDARGFADEFNSEHSSRGWSGERLKKMLRGAVEEKPLVCLLDDWDEAQRFHWDNMLLDFARVIARDLPVLLFVTIKEPINLKAPEKDESGLAKVIESLLESGVAEWWPLSKLSRDEVAAAIGEAAPGIAAKLHGVTGGNARWVRELWREWRLAGVVLTDEADRWVWGERSKTTLSLYEEILEDRLARLLKAETAMEAEEAREVLACAALEGVRFTADAVALALDWDRDELIDFLDAVLTQSEDNPDGLLLEDDGIEIHEPDGTTRTVWRYSFVSDLHWMALERYGFAIEPRPGKQGSQKLEKSAALINALREIYAPEERYAAAPLARLLREVGDGETARHYQRMADYAAKREVMREQALHLLIVNKDHWEPWQCERAGKFLIEAGRAMMNAFPHHETLSVCEEACRLARRAKNREDEAHAQYLCGFILHAEGENKLARERANDSLHIFRLLENKNGMAVSLHVLAQIDYAEGNYTEARERAALSLESEQEIGNRHGASVSLHLLAQIDAAEGNYDKARERASRALQIAQEIGDREGVTVISDLLARIDKEVE